MLCCCRISLEHTTENMASLSGPFIKRYSRKLLGLFACYIICQYISLGSIVLKLFITMKNTIIPIRPAGKCIQIQFIKSDLSWIGSFTKLLSRNSDN